MRLSQLLQQVHTDYIEGIEGTTKVMKQVMEALLDKNRKSVGIHGPGGIGKTTVIRKINNMLIGTELFERVITVVVSQNPNLECIQEQIAKRMDLYQTEVNTELHLRAKLLCNALREEERVLIMLDDVRAKLQFQQFGIPTDIEQEGCKILLVSRMETLHHEMDIQTVIPMKSWPFEDMKVLFESKVANIISSPAFGSLAAEIVKGCQGIPLAVATLGLTLARSKNVVIWHGALGKLRTTELADQEGNLPQVTSSIKFAYDNLSQLKVYGIGEGFLQQNDGSLKEAREVLLFCIKELKALGLLMDSDEKDSVKMHDVLHTLLLQENSFQGSVPVHSFQGMEKLVNLEPRNSQFAILPPSILCLTNLRKHITHREPEETRNTFTKQLWHQRTSQEISQLINLKMLNLRDNYRMTMPPNVICTLSRLEELYMGNSFCNWEFEGEGKDTNASLGEVISLFFLTALELHVDETGVLCGFNQEIPVSWESLEEFYGISWESLEEFYVCFDWKYTERPSEFSRSLYFSCLSYPVPVWIKDLLEQTEHLHGLKELTLWSMPKLRRICHGPFPTRFMVNLVGVFSCVPYETLINIERLYITGVHGLNYFQNPAAAPVWPHAFQRLQILELSDIKEMKAVFQIKPGDALLQNLKRMRINWSIHLVNVIVFLHQLPKPPSLQETGQFDSSGQDVLFARNQATERGGALLPSLKSLELDFLPNLEGICKGVTAHVEIFSNLRFLTFKCCKSIRSLFCPLIAQSLQQLRNLKIEDSKNLETLISNREGTLPPESLPHAVSPLLQNLRMLDIRSCEKLKGLISLSMALPKLQIFECEEHRAPLPMLRSGGPDGPGREADGEKTPSDDCGNEVRSCRSRRILVLMASSIMDSLFQRSLDDLIKSLRSPIAPLPTIISKATDDIRRELKSTDLALKSIALQKLTYLSSLHSVDMSFASFHVVELMSSPHFSHKKTGYLAASLSFHQSTDVLLLLPNQLRKDLTSPNVCESSLALEFLAVGSTHELARELTQDIFTLLSSAKTLVRRKAIAVLLRFYDKYPDSVRVTFKRLVENLESTDPNVVSAAAGVFCELTAKDPKSYLPLAPEFYRILTDSKSNWVLIKLVKIFAKLAPLEPRLARKVVEPICEIMTKTGAKSLMFECIRAIALSLPDFDSAVRLAVGKIRELLSEDDSNLKCLGLQALTFLGEKHLWATVENKEIIIKFLSDDDPNIKLEALRLLMGMVSEDNVEEITRILLKYAITSDPEFSNEILRFILTICSRQVYEIVVDFDWYVALLGEMARYPHCKEGDEIERQMIDIGLRVKDVRPELVRVSRGILIDPALLGNPNLYRVMAAAAWVSGEYVEFSVNPQELVEALLQPRTSLLPPLVRAIYLQAVFKILVFILHSYFEGSEIMGFEVSMNYEGDELSDSRLECKDNAQRETFTYDSLVYLLNLVKMAVQPLVAYDNVEVQERASNVVGLIQAVEEAGYEKQEGKSSQIVKLMVNAFSEELGPVSLNAQERVRMPDGLTLKDNLADLDAILGDDFSLPSTFSITGYRNKQKDDISLSELPSESISVLEEHRKRHGLYYLPAQRVEGQANDYPPPVNDPIVEATRELVKLTDRSLTMKKSNRVKPRPVVVKLDDGDEVSVVKVVRDFKDDMLSGAVRDLLLSDELNPSAKSSQGRMKEKTPMTDSVSKENLDEVGNSRNENSSSRKSKHRRHGKERHNHPHKSDDKEERTLRKSSNHHGKHKARHRADEPLEKLWQWGLGFELEVPIYRNSFHFLRKQSV
ncbi:hypothetical protein H6P81_004718 [Aristolochia fimbriata]|uniref:AAA+ ATPase domain-containing protein n=1 Tax=Aristolochia fimbriata TaxID=158543 RepID=A0AAV7ET55_ARIFI|nr:hypothetical protein H6P81_004718 [Aristolochia fimbriata]